jgi:hypothetical protein
MLLLLCALGLLAQGASPAQAATAEVTAASGLAAATAADTADIGNSSALANLSACLAEKKQGDLVLLMDTSGSLGTAVNGDQATDPKGVRVDAAEVLLDRLAASQAKSGAAIDVALVGFSSDYTVVQDFTPLGQDQLGGLQASVERFRDLDKGFETDFWTALTSLSSTMAQRAANRDTCQFFIWFTDGELSYGTRDGIPADDPRTPPETDSKNIPGYEGVRLTDATVGPITDAARNDLCRPGGVADSLRVAGITTIAVGLGGSSAANQPDFGLIQRISENPSGDCGSQPARGLFVATDSLSSLFLAFDAIGGPSDGIDRLKSQPICPPQAPPNCGYTFPLDDVLSGVHLAAAVVNKDGSFVPSSDLMVELTAPGGGPPLQIPGGGTAVTTAAVGPIVVKYRWYPQGPVTIDLTRPPGASWEGTWTLKFIDTTGRHADAVSNIQLILSSDLMTVPQVEAGPWRAGETSPQIVPELERLDGTPENLDTPKLRHALAVTAELVPAGSDTAVLSQTVDPNSPFTMIMPAGLSPGSYTLKTSLVVTMAGSPLPARVRQTTVTIEPPLGSPTLDPAQQELDFGLITGTATSAARSVIVAAPADAEGCVWVTTGDLKQHPESIQSVVIGTPADTAAACQHIPAGQTVEVPLTLTPGAEGNNELAGTADVFLAPAADVTRVSQTTVDYTAMTIRTPQNGVKVIVFVVVMLLGLLIPLLALWLLRRLGARFPSDAALSAIALNVQVGPAGLVRPGGSAPDPPTSGWLAVGAPTDGRRVLQVAGVALRARAGWQLSQPGYAEVVDDAVGTCGSPPHFHPKTGRPRLPLAVQGIWMVLARPAEALSPAPDIPARLVLVVSSQADDTLRAELLGAASRDAVALMVAARSAAAAAAPGNQQDPGEAAPAVVGAAGGASPFAEPGAAGGWGGPGGPAGGGAARPNPFGPSTGGPPSAGGPADPFGRGATDPFGEGNAGAVDDPWGRSR